MPGVRERQKRERERRILRAAGRLFETRGYADTSLEAIARRARLAVGTIYNYFESKPEILLAIVRGDTTAALTAGESILKQPPPDPRAAVAALMDAYLEPFARHDRQLWRELLVAALADPQRIATPLFGQDLRLIGQLCTLLRELQTRGVVGPEVDAGRAAIVLYSIYLSWFMALTANDALDLDTLRAELRHGVGVVMDGLLQARRGDSA